MKLFVTSDIHSYFQPFKKALDSAGFDPNNEEHWLIVCGDCFDRGPDSEDLLYFLMSLERKILVKGNHDILLEECCLREFPQWHDSRNGTKQTIQDLGSAGEGNSFDICCQNTWHKTAAYRDCLVNYFETYKYIFVHSWIPLKCNDNLPMYYTKNRKFEFNPDWRNANDGDWTTAMWGNPYDLAEKFLPDKTIVFGHFHTSYPRHIYESKPEWGKGSDFSIYRGNGYIAIDACCAYSGKINVLVLEDEFLED